MEFQVTGSAGVPADAAAVAAEKNGKGDSDANGDGRMDERFVYSWRRPMGGDVRPRTILADGNGVGRW